MTLVSEHVAFIVEGFGVVSRGSRVRIRLNMRNEGWLVGIVDGVERCDFQPPTGHFALTLSGVCARLREAGAHVVVDVIAARYCESRAPRSCGSVGDTFVRARAIPGDAA